MELVKTFHLGHDNTDDIALIDKAHTVRFCLATIYSHATVIAQLSKPFNKAQMLWQEGNITEPYHVVITYPYPLDHKRKESDSESIFDRFLWMIENMRIPDCGMTVSVYHAPDTIKHIVEPWAVNEFWTMKEQNSPLGEYITMQRLEKGIGGNKKEWTYNEVPKYMKLVEDWANQRGIEIKYIDYAMPYQEMYETLLGSDGHFTYCGSTYYFAGMIGLRTYGLAPYFNNIKSMESYYTLEGADRIPVEVENSYWASIGINGGRITQFDHEQGAVVNMPPDYLRHMHDFPTLKSELNKLNQNFM